MVVTMVVTMTRTMWTLAAAALLMLAPLAAQKPEAANSLMQAAIKKEVVDGDLNGAIKQYGWIVAKYAKTDRAVTAMALVHMAECHRKMGDAEARKIYEQVTRDYADQKEAVTIARARLGSTAPSHNAGIITRQVWTGPTVDALGTVSPDGRVLSFVDWSTGDLAVHDLATGEDRRLTHKGTWADNEEFAEESTISRDGKQVAYAWFNKDYLYELRLVDLNGGAARLLFFNPDISWVAPYDWSPDGKWLAVQLTKVDRTLQIGLVSTADGALRVLKSPINFPGPSKLAFSPDGKFLAYDLAPSEDSEQHDVYVMALDDSRETSAVVHPANDMLLGWTPDGKHLLFASDRSGKMAAWAIAMSGGKPQGGAELIKADISPGAMGLTRSGALYYGVRASGEDVYVASIDFDKGKVLSAPANIAPRFVGSNRFPEWSSDGKYLAYISRRDPSPNGARGTVLEIRSTETGKVRELRPDLQYLQRVVWSPDGTYLLVSGTDRKGGKGVYRIDRESGSLSQLLKAEGRSNLIAQTCSPDGKVVYVRRNDANKDAVLLAHDMASGTEHEIVRAKSLFNSDVARDGRLVVAAYNQSTKATSVLVFPAGGGEPRELLRIPAPEGLSFVAWSPDARFLIFVKTYANDNNRHEVWKIAPEGGAPQKLDFFPHVGNGPIRIHPDGHQVAFGTSENQSEVWTMENFLSSIK